MACDDNSSVQNGIVVNSPIKRIHLPMVALAVLAVVQAAQWARAASSRRQRERRRKHEHGWRNRQRRRNRHWRVG